jgi:hypothetical protein
MRTSYSTCSETSPESLIRRRIVGLRDRLRRLRRAAEEGGVLIHQRDGSVRAFEEKDVFAAMFMARSESLRGVAYQSEVLDAVRNAAPESRAAFEERFGSIRVETKIVNRSGEVSKIMVLTEEGEALTLNEAGEVIGRGPREVEDLLE